VLRHCASCGRAYLLELPPEAAAQRATATALPAWSERSEPSPAATVSDQPGFSTTEPILSPVPVVTQPAVRRSALRELDVDLTPPMPSPARRPPARATNRRPSQEPLPEIALDAIKPGRMLGGYKLVACIGAGAMGTVWLARQISLDRNVAVKILRPALANNPAFVMQFTHEALASAQLVHHNIAQIYDTAADNQLHYFSMEYVEGESLSAMVRRVGKLDPEVAAGYALQAARGLKFAHDRALIHRDVNPENLLLNGDVIVKVADLGLVKRAGAGKASRPKGPSGATLAEDDSLPPEAIGTPAFMAPEQANGEASLDARADIYSLGCTLYALVTGRPPFVGDTPIAVITKHFTEDPVPPEQLVKRITPTLSAIILKMMSRKPEHRFQNMDAVISALEGFLGVDSAAAFSPREEHATLLERSVQHFNRASWARRRAWVRGLWPVLIAAIIALAIWQRSPRVALGAGALGVGVWLASALINAFAERSVLMLKLRQWVFGASPWLWLLALVLGSVGAGALGWFGLARYVLGAAGLSVVLALIFYLLVDRRASAQRRAPLEAVEEMLKPMRLRGLEENALRQFVCKYSGRDWEPFYEALFGYEAKLLARAKWGRDDKDQPRKRRGVWRDPLVRWLNRRLERRQRAKARRHLATLEANQGAPG